MHALRHRKFCALPSTSGRGSADCLTDHLIGAQILWIGITGTLQLHYTRTLHVHVLIYMVPSNLFTVTSCPMLLVITAMPPEHHCAQSHQCEQSPLGVR